MKLRLCTALLLVAVLAAPVNAEPIRWVDFDVPYDSLKYAMDVDIDTCEKEEHISWIDILALAACRTGGKCGIVSVRKAAEELHGGECADEILGADDRFLQYYREAYSAVLGGLLGHYAVQVNGQWKS